MKNGLLSKLLKGKKSPPGTTEVDRAVAAICDLESQVTAAGEGLHQARTALERSMTAGMVSGKTADHTGMTTGVAEARARLDGALRMLEAARAEAAHVIDAGRPGYRDTVELIDGAIKAKQRQIGRRRAEAIAAFCHLQGGLDIEWPSDHRGGLVRLPVLGLDVEEYQEITAMAATQPVPADAAETALAELRDRLLTMQTLAEQPASMALDMLVTRVSRKNP